MTGLQGTTAGALLVEADAAQVEGRFAEAIALYRRALALDDREANAWFGLGCALGATNVHGEAVAALRRAADLGDASPALAVELAKSLFALGDVDAAVDLFGRAGEAAHEDARAVASSNLALILPGDPRADNAAVLRVRRDWCKSLSATAGKHVAPPRRAIPAGGKLRVGYVSSFFGARNWMKPVYGVVNHHDRSRHEIHLFADGKPPTAEAGYRDHDADYIHNVAGASNDKLAAYIRDKGIDVLVDLNGYSAQPQLGLFAHRPAPAVVGWFNMFATGGLAGYANIVGDESVIPKREEKHYVERVWRLPGSYLAFEVLYPVPDVVPPPSTLSGRFAFGCLGSQYKITDQVIAAWAEILSRAPRADLYVRNGTLSDASCRASLRERFAARGIAADRLRLDGGAEHYDFLAAYANVDVALDTFPYNGGTTTTEALWQGVPVLAFDGDRWASRTSKSLLVAAGLGDWCVANLPAYVERAVALANDPVTPAMLAGMRPVMRARLAASAACDTSGLCRSLEAIYAKLAGR